MPGFFSTLLALKGVEFTQGRWQGIKHSAQMEATPLSLWKVFPLLYSLFLSFSSSLLVLAPISSVPSSFVHTLFFFYALSVWLSWVSVVTWAVSGCSGQGLLTAVASPDAEHRL